MTTITSLEQRAMLSLAAIFLLRMLGLFMVLPVFAIYAEQLNYVNPTLIGIALGAYGLTQAIFQIPFGLASDRFGRKPIIGIGLGLFAMGSGVAALSDSIYGVIIGRCLQGMSAVGCVIMALVSDLTREEIRARAMAVIGITIGLSFALAIVLGPLLSDWAGGVKGLFWITALLALLAILMLVVLVPKSPLTKKNNEIIPILALLPKVLVDRQLIILNFGVLVLHASLTALFLKIPIAVQHMGFTEANVWRFYLPMFLASLIASIPFLLLIGRKKSDNYGMFITVLTLAISEAGILYFFKIGIGLAISLWLFFTTFNVLEASLPSWVSKVVPQNCKGTALGLYSTFQFLGLFLGGVIGGWLDAFCGTIGVLLFCVVLAIIWLLWILQQFFMLREV